MTLTPAATKGPRPIGIRTTLLLVGAGASLLLVLVLGAGCGATGAEWEPPEELFSIEREPAGESCPAGGFAVLSGPDLNGDGVLGEDEVLSVKHFCDEVCGRHGGILRIARQEDWHALAASNCTFLAGDLEISARGLAKLPGPAALQHIDGELRVLGTNALTTLAGLEELRSIGGGLIVSQNEALSSLIGLGALESIGPSLERLDESRALPGVLIAGNSKLTTLTGIHSLERVGGDMVVSGNQVLANLFGPRSLCSIGGGLVIEMNPALITLDGMKSLRSVGDFVRAGAHPGALEGGLHVVGNVSLVTTEGLEELVTIGGPLRFSENHLLLGLEGLRSLTSVGELSIRDNRGLRSLRGLESLSWIGGDLLLERNFQLGGMIALGSVSSIGRNLRVIDNTVLPSCQAEVFHERLAAAGWRGDHSIQGNDDSAVCD